jgi:hypothetical protein
LLRVSLARNYKRKSKLTNNQRTVNHKQPQNNLRTTLTTQISKESHPTKINHQSTIIARSTIVVSRYGDLVANLLSKSAIQNLERSIAVAAGYAGPITPTQSIASIPNSLAICHRHPQSQRHWPTSPIEPAARAATHGLEMCSLQLSHDHVQE